MTQSALLMLVMWPRVAPQTSTGRCSGNWPQCSLRYTCPRSCSTSISTSPPTSTTTKRSFGRPCGIGDPDRDNKTATSLVQRPGSARKDALSTVLRGKSVRLPVT